jgi:hypothetical protein
MQVHCIADIRMQLLREDLQITVTEAVEACKVVRR